jgi:hypothetical protein
MVYETRAITPNPAPRTWVQKYSEYRQGVPEYVELPIASPVVAASSRMAFDSTPVNRGTTMNFCRWKMNQTMPKAIQAMNSYRPFELMGH